MTATSPSSPSREPSEAREDLEIVLPPTLFRLPNLAHISSEASDETHADVAPTDKATEYDALIGESLDQSDASFERAESPKTASAHAAALADDVKAAPIFEIRYDEAHSGPPRQHSASTSVADPEKHASERTETASSTPAPHFARGTASVQRSAPRDFEPEPRSAFEKYGSRVVVAAALVLIASAAWLMGRDDELGTGGTEFAGDSTAPSDATPGPFVDDNSQIAAHATDDQLDQFGVPKSDIVSATLGKPAAEALTLDHTNVVAESSDHQSADVDPALVDEAKGAAVDLATNAPSAMDAEMVAAQRPNNDLDAGTTAPATNLLGNGPIPIDVAVTSDANASPVQQPVADQMAAPVTQTQPAIRATATPRGVSDWLKYLPQPNMGQATPDTAELAPSQASQQAAVTTTPNDPYAAYQNYISESAGTVAGPGSPPNAAAAEPLARTAANPYPGSYTQPTSTR